MQETWVDPWVGKIPLEEEGMAPHSGILARGIPRTEEPGSLQTTGHKESDMTEQLSTEKHVLPGRKSSCCQSSDTRKWAVGVERGCLST